MLSKVEHDADIITEYDAKAITRVFDLLLTKQLTEPSLMVVGLIFPVVRLVFLRVSTIWHFRLIILSKLRHPLAGLIQSQQMLAPGNRRSIRQVDLLHEMRAFALTVQHLRFLFVCQSHFGKACVQNMIKRIFELAFVMSR